MKKIYGWIDKVWGLVSETIFVRFDFDLPVETLKEYQQQGKLVFASTNGGWIDWLILSSWCRTQGLGAILVANRKRILILAKPLYFLQILFRTRSYADLYLSDEPGPRLIFCPSHERKKIFDPTPVENLLGLIYTKCNNLNLVSTIHFVPIFIRWRKHVRGEARSLNEYLFGLSSHPNLIGKMWYLVRRRKDSTVKALPPFTMSARENIEGTDTFEESEAIKIAKNTRRKILILVNQEMRVVLGPRFYSPHSVKESLMRDPEIQKAIREEAQKTGMDQKKVMMLAYRYFTEIVANYTYRFIEVMYVVLNLLFSKVFDGVVVQPNELQAVREIMKTKPVIFVSCHRSHLDYQVIPYVLFLEDMVTPHIAAGINLAFWPIGPFLRMGGAFFIRRSFRGNALYTICLKKYVEYLMKNRVNIKFFIEGTRSRSGKMLPPAFGFLKMVLDAYQHKVIDDVALVPVSIVYDEVLEERSYTKELSGGQKQAESAKGLLKWRKLIKRNIGKVYVHLAPAMYAREIYQNAEQTGLEPTLTLQKTAFQLCKSINDFSPVTPKSIVCSILISHRLGSLSLEEILRLSEAIAAYVDSSKIELSVERGSLFRRAIEQTVRRLQKNGLITVSDGIPRTYFCENQKRVVLSFYKNNAIHCLAIPSITLLAFFSALRSASRATSDLNFNERFNRAATGLRNLLKFEFFFSPTHVFINEIQRTFNYFASSANPEQRWDDKPMKEWVEGISKLFTDWNDVSIYTALVGDLLESYLTAAHFLKEEQGATYDKKTLVQKILKYGESLQATGNISYSESLSIQNYSNALMLFENFGFLKISKAADKVSVTIENWNEEMDSAQQQLAGFLELMQENPENFIHPELRKYWEPVS